MVIWIVVVPADILPASLVDTSYLFAKTIDNIIFGKTTEKSALAVRFKVRESILRSGYVLYNCFRWEWFTVNIFFNHISTSFSSKIGMKTIR